MRYILAGVFLISIGLLGTAQEERIRAALEKMGGGLSIETEHGQKLFKVDFTNQKLGNDDLRIVKELQQPCMLEL